MRAWIGFLAFAVWIGGVSLRVRAPRRSGNIQDFGHPVLDKLLLLGSGLLLTALLVVAIFLFGEGQTHPLKERVFACAALLGAGGLLTWLCNAMLRGMRK